MTFLGLMGEVAILCQKEVILMSQPSTIHRVFPRMRVVDNMGTVIVPED